MKLLSTNPIASQSNSQNAAILRHLQSGQLLRIAPDSTGSLLIVKSFYVDFAGAGAAIGGEFDRRCTAVCVIGNVRLQNLATQADRDEAILTRIAYAERLTEILDIPVPLRRGRLIVDQLSQWLPGNLALTVPAELAAGLAGILPMTVRLAWRSHKELADDLPTLAA